MAIDAAVNGMPALLERIQHELFEKALKLRAERTYVVDDYEEFKRRIDDGGFFLLRVSGADAEARIKADTMATLRVYPLDGEDDPGPCIVTGEPVTGKRAIFARSY
jgi:prolyl-tRNA synthetase